MGAELTATIISQKKKKKRPEHSGRDAQEGAKNTRGTDDKERVKVRKERH